MVFAYFAYFAVPQIEAILDAISEGRSECRKGRMARLLGIDGFLTFSGSVESQPRSGKVAASGVAFDFTSALLCRNVFGDFKRLCNEVARLIDELQIRGEIGKTEMRHATLLLPEHFTRTSQF